MAPQPIDQDRCFYVAPWSREVETLVLNNLDTARSAGKWVNGNHEDNEPVLARVQARLSRSPWDLNITWDQYTSKVLEWEARYFEFSYLIKESGVQYCQRTNKVIASYDTWERLCQVYKKYRRYIIEGELNYKLLNRLFSCVEINSASASPPSRTLILSSSTSSEEVTSAPSVHAVSPGTGNVSCVDQNSGYGSYDGAAHSYGSHSNTDSGYGSYEYIGSDAGSDDGSCV